jgi:hypothetical protein
VADVSWSRCGPADCLRVAGVDPQANVRVRPRTPEVAAELPSMAGELVRDGADTCFVPRFAFVEGTAYTVLIDGVEAAALVRPRPDRRATKGVLDIGPTAAEVPRNLLRIYVWFSARMSEGYAARHVRLVDDADEEMVGALLPTEHELWDAERHRLTVLLDPARIKRGLAPQRQAGYPLRRGRSFRIVIDDGFRDASGSSLRAPGGRRYEVGPDERRLVRPEGWTVTPPSSGTVEPLEITFDRPLDHGLLARCLQVVGPDGRRVNGDPATGAEERSWRLVPPSPWAPGAHKLVVDHILEDLAGNSVSRVFDRDLTRVEDEPREAGPVSLPFRTGPPR